MRELWCLCLLVTGACFHSVSELACFEGMPCPTGYECLKGVCVHPYNAGPGVDSDAGTDGGTDAGVDAGRDAGLDGGPGGDR